MHTSINVELNLTPDQLAEVFINWGSDEQANFFNLIGKHFKECDFNAELQCCYLADDINKHGKDFIFTVSNFVKCRGITNYEKSDVLINSYEHDSLNFGL